MDDDGRVDWTPGCPSTISALSPPSVTYCKVPVAARRAMRASQTYAYYIHLYSSKMVPSIERKIFMQTKIYEGRPINKLQNGIILLIFKI